MPADVRLLSAIGLEIDESALTGETKPAKKTTDVCIPQPNEVDDKEVEGVHGLALSERKNVAFMGTLVRSGAYSPIPPLTPPSSFLEATSDVRMNSMDFQVTEPELSLERESRPSLESSFP